MLNLILAAAMHAKERRQKTMASVQQPNAEATASGPGTTGEAPAQSGGIARKVLSGLGGPAGDAAGGGVAKGLGRYAADRFADTRTGKLIGDVRAGVRASGEKREAGTGPAGTAQQSAGTEFRSFGDLFMEAINGRSQ
jgi:hypothetical protein